MDSITRRTWMAAAASTGMCKAAPAKKDRAGTRRSMQELRGALRGVHNFLTTPFRPDLTIDADGLRRNVAHHASKMPADMTIVVGGGLGELFTMDADEQRAMAAAAVAGSAGRLPVVVGAGGGYRVALRMAENAEKAGADAILLFSPPYGSESADGAFRYFREVAASVRIGVIAYPRGKEDYWPMVLQRLAEIPNVIGFKDPTGGTSVGQALGSLIKEGWLWIAEGETHALEALPAGSRAYTTAVATLVPNACHEFWKHGVAGERAKMRTVMETGIDPVVRVRSLRPNYGISGIKVALEALGRAGGPVRPPGTNVAPEDRAAIAEIARKHSEA